VKLADAIEMAESALERGLNGDEIVLVGRMVDAGSDAADILEMLDKEAPQPETADGRTFRYEARGDRVVQIE
jgi:hypothetical protein